MVDVLLVMYVKENWSTLIIKANNSHWCRETMNVHKLSGAHILERSALPHSPCAIHAASNGLVHWDDLDSDGCLVCHKNNIHICYCLTKTKSLSTNSPSTSWLIGLSPSFACRTVGLPYLQSSPIWSSWTKYTVKLHYLLYVNCIIFCL